MIFEYKLEGAEEAEYVGICGKKSPGSLSLVCSRTLEVSMAGAEKMREG